MPFEMPVSESPPTVSPSLRKSPKPRLALGSFMLLIPMFLWTGVLLHLITGLLALLGLCEGENGCLRFLLALPVLGVFFLVGWWFYRLAGWMIDRGVRRYQEERQASGGGRLEGHP